MVPTLSWKEVPSNFMKQSVLAVLGVDWVAAELKQVDVAVEDLQAAWHSISKNASVTLIDCRD